MQIYAIRWTWGNAVSRYDSEFAFSQWMEQIWTPARTFPSCFPFNLIPVRGDSGDDEARLSMHVREWRIVMYWLMYCPIDEPTFLFCLPLPNRYILDLVLEVLARIIP